MRHLYLTLAFFLGLAVSAWAEPDGWKAAFESGDYGTALRELEPLAEEGNADAQALAGHIQFLMSRYPESVEWYRRAAEQGHPEGLLGLAKAYWQGWGVPQKFVQAYMWSSLAESRLVPSERHRAIEVREGLAPIMTPDQIAEAEKLARKWQEKH